MLARPRGKTKRRLGRPAGSPCPGRPLVNSIPSRRFLRIGCRTGSRQPWLAEADGDDSVPSHRQADRDQRQDDRMVGTMTIPS